MNGLELLKNLGAVLATVTTIVYATGYLTLRARAHALGTDPNFKLMDEAYVFAGFRFVFATLLALLLVSPALVLGRWVASHLNGTIAGVAESVLLLFLAFLAVFSFLIFQVTGLLFLKDDAPQKRLTRLFADAVLGNNALGLLLSLVGVVLAAISVYWLHQRLSLSHSVTFTTLILAVVAAIHVLMMPIYHGVLFADRNVRVLNAVPDGVAILLAPVGIIAHSGEHVVILGHSADGTRQVVTVPAAVLERSAVVKIQLLKDFLTQRPSTSGASDSNSTGVLGPTVPPPT